MPHSRARYLKQALQSDLKWSKTVSILGMRQVGKTTLVKEFAQSYFSFDEGLIRLQGQQEDWSFLEGAARPVALDECQMVPGAFSQVKHRVDQSDRPGQFILTGSVRFLSKKDIRESLTGRTSLLELLPMNLSELHSKPLSHFFHTAQASHSSEKVLGQLKKNVRFKLDPIRHLAQTGGLPGICFRRDEKIRERLWDVHLETILSRDIEMIAPTRLGYFKIRRLLMEVLEGAGLPMNKALLAKKIGTSGPTVNRLLDAFEALFLIKKHGASYYPTDLGLSQYLVRGTDFDNRLSWLRILYTELRTHLEYRYRSQYELTELRTRGGLDIPFLVEIKDLGLFAFTVDAEERASDKSLKSLTWYKKRAPKARTLSLHLGTEAYLSTAGHLCLPIAWIF